MSWANDKQTAVLGLTLLCAVAAMATEGVASGMVVLGALALVWVWGTR